ncbi:MAG: DNA polymerase Y family protein [Phycisphaerales bacterium]|jgi:protein ImuB|nr:DNA polymerase Y family protein [Phycisphaerales bacterium]
MLGLSVYLPTWPTDLARRRGRVDPRVPIVLSRRGRRAEVVAAACAVSMRRGISAGMSMAEARMVLSNGASVIEPIDDHAVRGALRRLAFRMTRWVPLVSIDGDDGLLCDAGGCERLYRGIDRLVRKIAGGLRAWGIAGRVAAAPTFGAAWAMARFGASDEATVTGEDLSRVLAELPLGALRLEREVLDAMARVGLERVVHLYPIPRAAIEDRYGASVLRRLDQALGRAMEAIEPIHAREPVRAGIEFDGVTDRLDAILSAARSLLADVCRTLRRLESGCRHFELGLDRSDLPPLVLTIRTARAARDAGHLWPLLAGKIESAQLGFGLRGLVLRGKSRARIAHVQSEHWRGDRGEHSAGVAKLIDTLNARLGVGAVKELRARESHVPEAAFTLDTVTTLRESGGAIDPLGVDRPSILYDEPRAIVVTLLGPNGPIATVRQGGRGFRVVCVLGPERIEPEWWRPGSEHRARDYFKVATEDGRVLWLFRSLARGDDAWFLHGQWA